MTLDYQFIANPAYRPSPRLSLGRKPPGDRLINVGVFVWLDLAVGHSGAGEGGDVGHALLLGSKGYPASGPVLPDRGGVDGVPGEVSKLSL